MGFSCKFIKYLSFFAILFGFFSTSCTVVKDYPKGKPFVFDNEINITNNISKDERKRLENDLVNYWDDSLYARKVQQFWVRFVLKQPPVFDTVNLKRTKLLMTGYLNAQGYYSPRFLNLDSSYTIDTVTVEDETQIRTTVSLLIDPGKKMLIDSLSYSIGEPFLDSLASANPKSSFIRPGKTHFSKQVVGSELDRIVSLFRQRGYFLLTREDLVAVVDTTNTMLLRSTFDPFEQAELIRKAEEMQHENPTCSIDIEKRLIPDSTGFSIDTASFRKYFIGRIYYFPETGRYSIPDSLMHDTASFNRASANDFTMFFKQGLFKLQPLREHTFQRKGLVYNEQTFFKTLNNFNRIGSWERVDYRTVIRKDTVDFYYFLTPAKKETISLNIETSRNSGDIISAANLIGLSFNISYLNRNVWKRAIQSSTTLSNGIEFSFDRSNPFLQTIQSSIAENLVIPRFVAPFKINKLYRLDEVKTLVSLNAAYSERKDFFRLRSFVGGWGYEWRRRNRIWQYKPLNIELYSLDTLPLLAEAFKTNAFLRTSFNTGSVISQQLSFNTSFQGSRFTNTTHYFRFAMEESGAILGRFKALQNNIYQYIKVEGEYHRLINLGKTAFAFRGFAGVGYNYYPNSRFGKTLPFFKQFIAGGPNSMRAWGLRLLGLGSSITSDTSRVFRDRYGDMQLEANAEYRFMIAQFSSLKLSGALFTDVGNIWNLHENPDAPGGIFRISDLGKDLAIGVGTGVRFDFNYFLIRVDFGIKLKDPARYENNGWLRISDFTWRNYEYADSGVPPRNNYAFQLGIGLPF